jgi:DNA-packaging protein gp3
MAHAGGRPRKFKSPEELEAAFAEYKVWAHANPWIKQDFVRAGPDAGTIVNLQIERALTEWEFAVFCGMSRVGLAEYCKEERPEFSCIYQRIKDEMSAFRVSGGLANTFNANLVARIDGIKEHSEIDHTITDNLADRISSARKRALDGVEPDAAK